MSNIIKIEQLADTTTIVHILSDERRNKLIDLLFDQAFDMSTIQKIGIVISDKIPYLVIEYMDYSEQVDKKGNFDRNRVSRKLIKI